MEGRILLGRFMARRAPAEDQDPPCLVDGAGRLGAAREAIRSRTIRLRGAPPRAAVAQPQARPYSPPVDVRARGSDDPRSGVCKQGSARCGLDESSFLLLLKGSMSN